MMRILRLAVVLAFALVIAGRAPGAWACTCVEQTEQQHFARADAVFVGTVTAKQDPEGSAEVVSSGRPIHWTFNVHSEQKGNVADPQVVTSAASDASCGYTFTVGRKYQVFADRQDGGRLSTGTCSGNRDLGAGEQLVATGEPVYPLAIGLFLIALGLLTRRATDGSLAR